LHRADAVVVFDSDPVLEAIRARVRRVEPKRQFEETALIEELAQSAELLGRKRFDVERRLELHPRKSARAFKKDSHPGAPMVCIIIKLYPFNGNDRLAWQLEQKFIVRQENARRYSA
jgi:hypothetical protein